MGRFKSTKTLIAFVLIALFHILNILYAITTASNFFDVINALISPPIVLILVYLLFEYKDFKFRKYVFPFAFGIIAFRSLYGVITYFDGLSRFTILEIELEVEIIFAIIIVAALFNILCFCGTLFKFKSSLLLKIGCIGYILTIITMQIYEFISLGGMEYIKSVPKDIPPINIMALIELLAIILFYIGVFIYSIDKKSLDSV